MEEGQSVLVRAALPRRGRQARRAGNRVELAAWLRGLQRDDGPTELFRVLLGARHAHQPHHLLARQPAGARGDGRQPPLTLQPSGFTQNHRPLWLITSSAPLGAVGIRPGASAVFAPRKTTSRTTCAASDEAMVYAPKHVLGGGERRPGRPGLGGDDGLGARAAQAPPTPRASCVAVLPRPFSMPLEPGRSRSGRCASPTSPRSLGRAPLPLTGRGGCSRPGGWRRRSLPPVALATDFTPNSSAAALPPRPPRCACS